MEDSDTPLADICFNEDLYSKPPTVEFTVIEDHAALRARKSAATISSSSNHISSSSSSGIGSSNSLRDNSNMTSSKSVNSNAIIGSGSSSSNSNSTSTSTYNGSINNSNTSNSSNNSSSNSSVGSGPRTGADFFSTFAGSRPKLIRTPGSDMSQKIAYNSGKEIPFDHDESKEMTVYSNGRNRKVYYGINGAPYYITDTGNVINNIPALSYEQFGKLDSP